MMFVFVGVMQCIVVRGMPIGESNATTTTTFMQTNSTEYQQSEHILQNPIYALCVALNAYKEKENELKEEKMPLILSAAVDLRIGFRPAYLDATKALDDLVELMSRKVRFWNFD